MKTFRHSHRLRFSAAGIPNEVFCLIRNDLEKLSRASSVVIDLPSGESPSFAATVEQPALLKQEANNFWSLPWDEKTDVSIFYEIVERHCRVAKPFAQKYCQVDETRESRRLRMLE